MFLVQIMIIGLSSWMIVGSDAVWESFWPEQFWKQQVASLEKSARKDLWHLKFVEWELMKGRIELSVAVSAAKDKGQCLGTNCDQYIVQAKAEATHKLRRWIDEEARAREVYRETTQRLGEAKEKLEAYHS